MLPLQRLVHLPPPGRVPLEHRGRGLGGHRRDVPGVAPGELAGEPGLVAIVGIARERVGVAVRVLVVRAPAADIDVVIARSVLGQRLLVVAGPDLELHPASAKVAWIAWAMSITGEVLIASIVT